jgi:hypothetical protein
MQQANLDRAQFRQRVNDRARDQVKAAAMRRQLNGALNPGHLRSVVRGEIGRYFPRYLRIFPPKKRLEKDLQNT